MKRLSNVLVPAVVLLAVSGCVTKDWVRDLVDRRDARIDQSLAGVEVSAAARAQRSTEQTQRSAEQTQRNAEQAQRSAEQAQRGTEQAQKRLETIDRRINVLESRASELEQRTQGVSTRADGAMARAEGLDARLTRLWASRNARTVVNILQVEFGFNQSSLDDKAKSLLFALVRELRDSPELNLDLEGYTDSKGSHQYNVRLSHRRVEVVRRYLVEQGVEQHRIRASARGPSDDAAVPEERKRRVDVKLVIVSD